MQPVFGVSACALAVAGFLGFIPAWGQSADAILVNGKVLTADPGFSIRQAVAIRDGRIAGVGSTTEMKRLAGSKTRVIDLDGRTVMPLKLRGHRNGD